jgi:hypothetical protein
MRRMTIFAAASCALALAAVAAGAQKLTVAYQEGEAVIRNGSTWSALAIGDAVAAEASVRLGKGSMLQFVGEGITLTLSRPGTYAIRDILASQRKMTARHVITTLANAIRALAFGSGDHQSTNSGARAVDMSRSDDGGWMVSTAGVYLDSGTDYLKSGNYEEAGRQFGLALGSADQEEIPQVRYYIAFVSSLKGDLRGAWKSLEGVQPGASEPWAPDFVLLKAKLLEETAAYTEAVDLLTQNDLWQDAKRSALYGYLLGVGCLGAGQDARAREVLSRVAETDRDSDLAKAAAALLKEP